MSRPTFIDRYTIERKEPHSSRTILRDNASMELVLMREISIYTHLEYKSMVEALEQQMDVKHPNLLVLRDYQFVLERVASEGPERKAICYFEYSKYPLDMEISCRQSQQQYFEESELWGMLFSLVRVLAFLQGEGIAHGCLSTAGVFIDEKSGQLKLCDPTMGETTPLELSENMFYSPQLLYELIHGSNSHEINMFKNDAFVLGMCMLEASLIENCCDCYLYDKGRINQHLLESKLIQLRGYYSDEYCGVIGALLAMDAEERPDFMEVEEMLRDAGMQSNIASVNQSLDQISVPEIIKSSVRSSNPNNHPTQNLRAQNLTESVCISSSLRPACPDPQQPKSSASCLSIIPDTLNSTDLQDYPETRNEQQLQARAIIQSTNRQLIKTRSYESLASVRSVESKDFHPTACGKQNKDSNTEKIEYSIREFSDGKSIPIIDSGMKATRKRSDWNDTTPKPGSKLDWATYVYQPQKDQIYTDPILVQLIKADMNEMARKRSAL